MYAIGGSVLSGIILGLFLPYESALHSDKAKEEERLDPQKFHFIRPKLKEFLNPIVLRGIFAVTTLQIGQNRAYGKLTASFGDHIMDPDVLTAISGISDTASALLGSGPVESIVAVTGGTPL